MDSLTMADTVYLYRLSDGKVLSGDTDLTAYDAADTDTYGTIKNPKMAAGLSDTGAHVFDGTEIRDMTAGETAAMANHDAAEVETQGKREAIARVDSDPIVDAMLQAVAKATGTKISKDDVKSELA